MLLLIEQILNGVQLGLLLFLLAAGLTLVFGIMDLVNLAHGSLYMVGAYLTVAAYQWTGSYALGVLLGLAGTLLVGMLVEVLTQLEQGAGGVATSSGMSACDLVLNLIEPGSLVIAPHDCYGGRGGCSRPGRSRSTSKSLSSISTIRKRSLQRLRASRLCCGSRRPAIR